MLDDLVARCTFPGDRQVLSCAVSGGADSLALLALARHAGHDVTAVHVDHGLRPGSRRDADVVRDAAGRFGAAFVSVRIELDPGPNLEARAREARYRALPPGCLTGHTADDQAETVLLALMRGSGPAGLRGIDPGNRPLLGLRRVETRDLCASLGLEAVADPANDDPRFDRNRVRHEVLPLLAEISRRDVVPLLCRSARIAGSMASFVESASSGIDGTDVAALRAADPVVASEALRRAHRERTGGCHPPDAASVERALRVVRGEAVATELSGGWSLRRRGGRLVWDHPASQR